MRTLENRNEKASPNPEKPPNAEDNQSGPENSRERNTRFVRFVEFQGLLCLEFGNSRLALQSGRHFPSSSLKLLVQILARECEHRGPAVGAVMAILVVVAERDESVDFVRGQPIPGLDCRLARDHVQ